MQPKRSLGNLSGAQPPTVAAIRSALTSQQQQQAYPFNYQAPMELHQRKRSIALIPNKFSVAAQQHQQFLKDWEQRGKQKKLFSRAATLDYEGEDYDEALIGE